MNEHTRRWLAFYLVCLGDFMIVLDISIVNVALPAIKASLGFGDAQLAWIINAYMLTYSGLLLLGGRLGDLYGQRRVYLVGLVIFVAASLACGLAQSQGMLIAARAVQGIGGAVLSAVAFSFILVLFTETTERVKAMGIFGFIMAGGGAVGVFLGGVITDLLGWAWIFLINVPIGVVVFLFSRSLLPRPAASASQASAAPVRLDVMGSVLVTLATLVFVYAIIHVEDRGWFSAPTLGLIVLAGALCAVFLWWEKRHPQPIMPLSIFKVQNVTPGMIIGGLWSSGMFAAFFMISLHLAAIMQYSPLQIGLTFLPANVVMAVVSIFLSARAIAVWGSRKTLFIGLVLVAVSLVIFAIMPSHASFAVYVLPSMLLFGAGGGLAMNPMLYASTAFVPPDENGLASGILNSTFSIGGTLGLSLLASFAALWHKHRELAGLDSLAAKLEGYHLAYWLAAGLVAIGAALALRLAEPPKQEAGVAMGH